MNGPVDSPSVRANVAVTVKAVAGVVPTGSFELSSFSPGVTVPASNSVAVLSPPSSSPAAGGTVSSGGLISVAVGAEDPASVVAVAVLMSNLVSVAVAVVSLLEGLVSVAVGATTASLVVVGRLSLIKSLVSTAVGVSNPLLATAVFEGGVSAGSIPARLSGVACSSPLKGSSRLTRQRRRSKPTRALRLRWR